MPIWIGYVELDWLCRFGLAMLVMEKKLARTDVNSSIDNIVVFQLMAHFCFSESNFYLYHLAEKEGVQIITLTTLIFRE